MKLRIRGDSIRMRVTQTELQTMAEEGVVEDTIHFAPDTALVYRLVSRAGAERPAALYTSGCVAIELPADTVARWAGTDEVSIRATQPLAGGAELSILVEKDFACLAPREGEDESDMFAHPEAPGGAKC